MAFVRVKGSAKNCRKYLSLASTAFVVGDLVKFDASTGVVTAATTNETYLGVVMTAKPSTDATTAAILIDIVLPSDEFLVDVGSGTAAATSVGKQADLRAPANNGSITLTASNNDVTIMGWDGYTTSKVIVKINRTVYRS